MSGFLASLNVFGSACMSKSCCVWRYKTSDLHTSNSDAKQKELFRGTAVEPSCISANVISLVSLYFTAGVSASFLCGTALSAKQKLGSGKCIYGSCSQDREVCHLCDLYGSRCGVPGGSQCLVLNFKRRESLGAGNKQWSGWQWV